MKYLKEYKEFEWDYEEYPDNPIPDDFIGYEKFYDFLVENDALDKWIKNLKGRGGIKKFLNNNDQVEYINYAFTWDQTPEGQYYWEKLHDKWNKRKK